MFRIINIDLQKFVPQSDSFSINDDAASSKYNNHIYWIRNFHFSSFDSAQKDHSIGKKLRSDSPIFGTSPNRQTFHQYNDSISESQKQTSFSEYQSTDPHPKLSPFGNFQNQSANHHKEKK